MIRGFILMVAAVLTVACGASQSKTQPLGALEGDAVALRFQSNQTELPLFYHEGRMYLLGEDGLTYEICIWNRSEKRVEAVVSVDGRDAVSGRIADYRKDRGYVILPDEEVCVEGFRKSLEAVAAFEFTSRGESYAAQMGDGSNVGVIGVAVFDEATVKPPVAIAADGDGREAGEAVQSSPTARSADADDAAESKSIGTGYGDDAASTAEIVPFKRSDPATPSELLSVFYDDRGGLEATGIRVPDDIALPGASPSPNPFPGSGNTEFAPPPPGQ